METVNDKAVVFLPWNTIEPAAQQQILNTASMPFVFKHVAVMPDCHYGKGATIGTVLATKDAIKVEQPEGTLGGPIRVRGKRGLWGDWAEREAGGEIAQNLQSQQQDDGPERAVASTATVSVEA